MTALELREHPASAEIYMFAGWRQWADAGSISSGLPEYLIEQLGARQIGRINPDGFYLFQIPGTHDLVRPAVKYEEGYPVSLEAHENLIYFGGDARRAYLILLGDEPHMNVERYVDAVLQLAREFRVKRMIGFGGVYGELPYDKERMVSSVYSLPALKAELAALAVNLSDYHGGASIGSVLCKRAGEQEMEYVSFYGFVPAYEFSAPNQFGNSIRIENDFMAWLGVMRRVNFMLKADFDLGDLEQKADKLVKAIEAKVDELDRELPDAGVREYLKRLSDDFTEHAFNPLEEVWEDELRRLFEKYDTDGEEA
jgi:proteasome assembly chaperone (PAC2) family protein